MSRNIVAILSLSTIAILASCTGLSESSGAAWRVRDDPARARRWELRADALIVFDAVTKRPLRRVPLEGASLTHARDICAPDLLLEPSGAMLVSSNAQPWIWRVGPERFEVERIEIRLEDASGRDVGFSALAWSGEGNALDAVDAATRAPWRIDLVSRKATRLSPGAGASSC